MVGRPFSDKKTKELGIILLAVCVFLLPLTCVAEEPGSRVVGHQPAAAVVIANGGIKKYADTLSGFTQSFKDPFNLYDLKILDDSNEDFELLNHSYIYVIGTQALSRVEKKAVSDTPVIFSSLVNWQRLPIHDNWYGVETVISPTVQLRMLRQILPDTKTLGILYSKKYNHQLIRQLIKIAPESGFKIIAHSVRQSSQIEKQATALAGKVDALWLIPDPLVLATPESLKQIFKTADDFQKPVLSYHPAFARYGAAVTLSADDFLTGFQVGELMSQLKEGREVKIQVSSPQGVYVSLNLGVIKRYGVNISDNALELANDLIQ